jgi:hypothetical protein
MEYIRTIVVTAITPVFSTTFRGEKIHKRRRVVIINCPLPLINIRRSGIIYLTPEFCKQPVYLASNPKRSSPIKTDLHGNIGLQATSESIKPMVAIPTAIGRYYEAEQLLKSLMMFGNMDCIRFIAFWTFHIQLLGISRR